MLANTLFILLNLTCEPYQSQDMNVRQHPFRISTPEWPTKVLGQPIKNKMKGTNIYRMKLAHRSWPTPNSILPPKISQQTPSPNNQNKMKGTNIYSMILAEECWPTPFFILLNLTCELPILGHECSPTPLSNFLSRVANKSPWPTNQKYNEGGQHK